VPAFAHTPPALQYEPVWHSSLIVHVEPFVVQLQGAQAPAVQVKPDRQSVAALHGEPMPAPDPIPPPSALVATPLLQAAATRVQRVPSVATSP